MQLLLENGFSVLKIWDKDYQALESEIIVEDGGLIWLWLAEASAKTE